MVVNISASTKVVHIGASVRTDTDLPVTIIRVKVKNIRDHAQNTTNPAILLVVNNVTPVLIGPPKRAPITTIMYRVGEGTRPCPFPVTRNGHGRVTEPQGDQFSGQNLGMVP